MLPSGRSAAGDTASVLLTLSAGPGLFVPLSSRAVRRSSKRLPHCSSAATQHALSARTPACCAPEIWAAQAPAEWPQTCRLYALEAMKRGSRRRQISPGGRGAHLEEALWPQALHRPLANSPSISHRSLEPTSSCDCSKPQLDTGGMVPKLMFMLLVLCCTSRSLAQSLPSCCEARSKASVVQCYLFPRLPG